MIPPAFQWTYKRLMVLGAFDVGVIGLGIGFNWCLRDRIDGMITLGPIYLGFTFDLTSYGD